MQQKPGATVRASIEHKGHYGFLGFNPQFILHLDIQFSNEERAIIRTRALQNYVFDLSPGFLAGSENGHSPEALAAADSREFHNDPSATDL